MYFLYLKIVPPVADKNILNIATMMSWKNQQRLNELNKPPKREGLVVLYH